MDNQDLNAAEALEDPDSLSFVINHDDGHCFDGTIDAPKWADVLTSDIMSRMGDILGQALAHEDKDAAQIAMLFTDNSTIAKLNEAYRGKSGPTDVLSFPADDDDGFLGDIALAYDVMATQAQEMKISMADHALHLMLHGTLHLCGHDHIQDDDAEVMESLEVKILADHNITNPYELTALEGEAS